MRRVSGKISLATRRIWGDPEDEDELSANTSSGLRYNGSDITTSIEEGGHSESAYNDGILPANDPRVSADCISFSDVKVRAKLIYSGQALQNDGELPIARKKSKSSLDEKRALLSTDSDTPDKILYNSSAKAPLPEQTDRDLKKNGYSSFHDSISPSVVCPPLSYHDISRNDFTPWNDTKPTRDHIEAPQDLHESMNMSHQCSKIKIEDQRVSEVMTKAENRFAASENSNPQENLTSTAGPYLGEHINDFVFENVVEDSSTIPIAIESKDLISRNSDSSSNEVPSKLNKLESCDEKISNNLENEISKISALLEIDNQLICKSSSEFHLQLCSKEIDDSNDTIHVVEPIIFNGNCVNQDYMSSSVIDLSDSLAVENKQNIDEALDKKTSTNLDLSDEIICLDQALPLRSHLEPKNNACDSVRLDEDKLSRCTEITEYTGEEFANPITSDSILSVAKDASDENNLVGLNAHERQMRSQVIGISDEEVDEGYTLITAYNNLYKKVRVSDTKFEDNDDFLRKSSNKYSDCKNIPLTNIQDSKENDNILSLSNGDDKYYCFQSSGLNLPDIVNHHTARVESIAHKDKSPEYDHKTDDIDQKGFEDTENLLEANNTSKEETSLNNDPNISNSAGVNISNLLDADSSNISVKDLKLDTEKYEVDLKDSDEVESRAEVESKNKSDEKIDEIIERIEDIFADTSEHTTTDTTTNNIVDTTADKIEDRIDDMITDMSEDTTADTTAYMITDTSEHKTTNTTTKNTVETTTSKIEDCNEDQIEEKTEEILDRIEDMITDRIEDTNAETTTDIIADTTTKNTAETTAPKTEDYNEDQIEEKTEEILDRIEDMITDRIENTNAETTMETATEIMADTTTKNTVETTAPKTEDYNEDQIEEKTEEILDRIEDMITDRIENTNAETTMETATEIIADTTTKNTVETTAPKTEDYNEDQIEEKTEEKIEEILDRIEDMITDRIEDTNAETTMETATEIIADTIADTIADNNVGTTAERIEDRTENKIEEKTEEKFLEVITRIEDRTEENANDIVENRVIEKITTHGINQAGVDIEANFFISEASKSENIGDKNGYNFTEAHGDINTHGSDLIISNDLKIESAVPIDQKFGKDHKKLPLEGAELSETETAKTTRNRKTWLRYVKSFEKRHEEGDSSSIKLSSGRESSGQSERVDRGETIAFTPKIPETPMKKKYAPSHSDSITPDKRRRSFRKKIKEKISDTLHKLKD